MPSEASKLSEGQIVTTNERKPRVVGLVRVSTKGQEKKGHGMEAQREAIKMIVRDNNVDLLETIEYSDVSGSDVTDAPQMKRLLGMIERKEIDGVAVSQFDRLMRPEFKGYVILQAFQDRGTILYTPGQAVDLTNPQHQLLVKMWAMVAGIEKSTIRNRVNGGKEVARKLGWNPGGSETLPFGVLFDKATKKYSYDPAIAPKVKEAAQLIIAGDHNLERVIKKANLRAPKTGNYFTSTGLRGLLLNPLMLGMRVWDKKADRTREGRLRPDCTRGSRPMVDRRPDEVIRLQVITPGLLTPEEVEILTALFTARTDRRRQMHQLAEERRCHNAPIYSGGILVCSCGEPLYTRYRRDHAYYYCKSGYLWRDRGEKRTWCGAPGMRADKLDQLLDEFFSTRLRSRPFIKTLLMNYDTAVASTDQIDRAERLQRSLTEREKERERLRVLFRIGEYTEEQLVKELKVLDLALRETRESLAQLRHTPRLTAKGLAASFDLMLRFHQFTRKQKQMILTSLFDRVAVEDYEMVSFRMIPDSECFATAFKIDEPINSQQLSSVGNTSARLYTFSGVAYQRQRVFIPLKPKARDLAATPGNALSRNFGRRKT